MSLPALVCDHFYLTKVTSALTKLRVKYFVNLSIQYVLLFIATNSDLFWQ